MLCPIRLINRRFASDSRLNTCFAIRPIMSYLLVHGMGEPVRDAVTELTFPRKGTYRMFVRTFDWTSVWHDGKGQDHEYS